MAEIRRPLLNLKDETGQVAHLGILASGRVRLRINNNPAHDLLTDTLEEMLLLSATVPHLSAGLYEQLHWELDMMGMRGD